MIHRRFRELGFCLGSFLLATLYLQHLTPVRAQSEDQSWYPSQYGASDTIGAANNMSPEAVRLAANLVTTGKVYSLAVAVDPNRVPRSHRAFRVTVVQPGSAGGNTIGPNDFTVNDDAVYLWSGLGTQIDGFAHAGINFRYYNGVHADEFVRPGGVTKFSIHEIPPLVGRGILMDMAGFHGVSAMEVGQTITDADLKAAARQQGLEFRKGDIVLIHTGWMDADKPTGPIPSIDEPGIGVSAAQFLSDQGIVAIGADNDALEVIPAEDRTQAMPVHQELLTRQGVYILENVVTRELARDQVWEFLFVMAAPRLMGTVQANVHPVAIR